MASFSSRYFISVILLLLVVGCLISLLLWPDPQAKKLYSSAHAAYQEKNYEGARQIFLGNEAKLLREDEGCELMISTLVELEGTTKELEAVADLCIKADKARDMALEAKTKILCEAKKYAEAEGLLVSAIQTKPSERLYAALGHVYVLLEQGKEATLAFVNAVKISVIGFVWMQRALKYRVIAENADALREFSEILFAAAKEDKAVPFFTLETLIEDTRGIGLSEEATKLEQLLREEEKKRPREEEPEESVMPANHPEIPLE